MELGRCSMSQQMNNGFIEKQRGGSGYDILSGSSKEGDILMFPYICVRPLETSWRVMRVGAGGLSGSLGEAGREGGFSLRHTPSEFLFSSIRVHYLTLKLSIF